MKVAYIACHGSFNPVHRHHVEMMVNARRKLESEGYRVVAGVLAPTNVSHLHYKGVKAMSDAHRFEALRIACDDVDGEPNGWLRFDRRGIYYPSCYKMMMQLLTRELQCDFPDIVGFDVKGADVVARYKSYWYDLRCPCVIFARIGDTERLMEGFRDAAGSGEESKPRAETCYVMEVELPGEFSSTAVREALSCGNDEVVHRMCPTLVAQYLLRYGEELFIPPPQEPPSKRHQGEPIAQKGTPGGPALRVVFIRHAEASHNADPQGWKERDPLLTPVGEMQASQLQDHELLQTCAKPRLVVVSPLRRALQTALLACGNDARYVANSDLQEVTHFPCDMGTPTAKLVDEFPRIDFGELDDAWVEKEPPNHHDPHACLDRFKHWCAARTENEIVVVTHQHVLRLVLGVVLDNCDLIAMTLNRESLYWEPLSYTSWNKNTLQWTAARGSPDGMKALLIGPDLEEKLCMDVGKGWPLLHWAAFSGDCRTVRLLLERGANASFVSHRCGMDARMWAGKRWRPDVEQILDEFLDAPTTCETHPEASHPSTNDQQSDASAEIRE